MRTSIQYKLLPLVIFIIVMMSGVFFGILMKNSDDHFERDSLREIQIAKKSFHSLQEERIRLLKAAIIPIADDPGIKEALQVQDRDTLLAKSSELQKRLETESGITHLNFYSPSELLLRVHAPELYGEPITSRAVVLEAAEKGSWGIGLEMGARGYALRVAYPVYDHETLVGYIEAGSEINPFMQVLKDQSMDDFVLIVDKKDIDLESWAEAKSGRRDNFDDLEDYVIVGSTREEGEACFKEGQLALATDAGTVFDCYAEDGKKFAIGGFRVFEGIKSERPALLLVFKDISEENLINENSKRAIIWVSVIMALFGSFIVVAILHIVVVGPLKRLNDAAKEIGNGNIHVKIPEIRSKDELSQLADTLETVVGAVKYLKKKQK